jgi:hypothetical protein
LRSAGSHRSCLGFSSGLSGGFGRFGSWGVQSTAVPGALAPSYLPDVVDASRTAESLCACISPIDKCCRCGCGGWAPCRVEEVLGSGRRCLVRSDYRVPAPGAAASTNTASGSRWRPSQMPRPSWNQRARPADDVHRSGDGGQLWRIAMLCCPEGATDPERAKRISGSA